LEGKEYQTSFARKETEVVPRETALGGKSLRVLKSLECPEKTHPKPLWCPGENPNRGSRGTLLKRLVHSAAAFKKRPTSVEEKAEGCGVSGRNSSTVAEKELGFRQFPFAERKKGRGRRRLEREEGALWSAAG